jgi:hypothetical protein
MVAIINSCSSVRSVLHYHENKVAHNAAQLIHSMNFCKDTSELGFTDKLKTIEKFTSLNERTKLNTVHISLNFDPAEKLKPTTLQQIADNYMQRIGFAGQPYLVYEHYDSGHPHIHIVSTNIQRDGTRIKMHNIGLNLSEPARKQIEHEFHLVPAQRQPQKQRYELRPVNAQKVQYGKSATIKAITTVLNAVLPVYKYSSLLELNGVLGLYNVMADRGGENSRVYKNNGLVYHVLDNNGQTIGKPVKASIIDNKPGLQFLTEKFAQNKLLKHPHELRIKNAIDFSFVSSAAQSLEQMIKALQSEKISVVLGRNRNDISYGITYIDHHTGCVFDGSELGKPYSASQLQQRCNEFKGQMPGQILKQISVVKPENIPEETYANNNKQNIDTAELHFIGLGDLAQILLQKEYESYLPGELRNRQRHNKKRKKR